MDKYISVDCNCGCCQLRSKESPAIDAKDLIKQFDKMADDGSFEHPHPIFKMAQDIDNLREENKRLRQRNANFSHMLNSQFNVQTKALGLNLETNPALESSHKEKYLKGEFDKSSSAAMNPEFTILNKEEFFKCLEKELETKHNKNWLKGEWEEKLFSELDTTPSKGICKHVQFYNNVCDKCGYKREPLLDENGNRSIFDDVDE